VALLRGMPCAGNRPDIGAAPRRREAAFPTILTLTTIEYSAAPVSAIGTTVSFANKPAPPSYSRRHEDPKNRPIAKI
jgi:hypothetical protein